MSEEVVSILQEVIAQLRSDLDASRHDRAAAEILQSNMEAIYKVLEQHSIQIIKVAEAINRITTKLNEPHKDKLEKDRDSGFL